MKRSLAYLLTLCYVLLMALSLMLNHMMDGNQFLYGKTKFDLYGSLKPGYTKADIAHLLTRFSQKYQTNISKHSYVESSQIYTYHTNLKNEPKINLSLAQEKQMDKGGFLENKLIPSKHDLFLFTPHLKLRFYAFDQLKNVGNPDALLVQKSYADAFEKEIGKMISFTREDENHLLIDFSSALFVGLVTLFFVILGLQIFYLFTVKKEYTLYTLWGYSKRNAIWLPMQKLFKMNVGNAIFALLLACGGNFILRAPIFSGLLNVGYVLLALLICNLLLNWAFGYGYVTVKEKNLRKILLTLSLIGKYGITCIVFVFIILSLNYQLFLKSQLSRKATWAKTNNIYRTNLGVVYNEKQLKEDRQQSHALKKLYTYLVEQKQGFIFETEKYNIVQDRQGKDKYENEMDAPIDEKDRYQRLIATASANYFQRNSIQAANGQAVTASFTPNPHVLNVIVPVRFKRDEKIINDMLLDRFYSQKVTVENIYTEALHTPPNTLQKADLKINLIYAKDQSKYFTYNSGTGNPRTNEITDPIVVIYDEKVDPSNLIAYTSSLFFVEPQKGKAYQNLLPILKQTENTKNIASVSSVYDELGQLITQFMTKLKENIWNGIIIFSLSLGLLTLFVYLICAMKQRTLFIKNLHGYSFTSLFKQEIIYLSVPTFLIGLFLYWQISSVPTLLLYTTCYLGLDVLLVSLLLKLFLNREIKEALTSERE